MKGLLCAVMVGTKCIAWFPRGTKTSDLTPVEGIYRSETGLRYMDWAEGIAYSDCPQERVLVKAMEKAKADSGYWCCLKTELALAQMNPMQRQHFENQ